MSIFGKKQSKIGEFKLPYTIALSFGVFLLTCLFSICYPNPAYNPSTGTDWKSNPILMTCFLAGGYGLLFILDFGVRYAFKKEDEENRITPWVYLGLGGAEFVFLLVSIILYFVAYPGVREGTTWFGRIAIAIVICLLSLFNIIMRIPKYLDFYKMFENDGHELINLSLIGILTSIPQLMLLVVVGANENRDTAKAAAVFVLIVSLIVAVAPFFCTKLLKNKKQTHTFSFLSSIAMFFIFLIFLFVYHSHFTQSIDPISYQEVYWAMFVYGYGMLVSILLAAYYGISLFLVSRKTRI